MIEGLSAAFYSLAGASVALLIDKLAHKGVVPYSKFQDLEYRLNSLEQKFISFRQSVYREDGHKNESGLIDSFVDKIIETGLRAVINTVTKPNTKQTKKIAAVKENMNDYL
jgi:hypothetical protein